VLPNSKVFGEVIINRTYRGTRRVELNIGVDYDADLNHVFAVAERTMRAHPLVLQDEEIWCGVLELADFAVTVRMHAWCKANDWWHVSTDLRRAIKEAFDAEKILFPYPHQVGMTRAQYLGQEPLVVPGAAHPVIPGEGVRHPSAPPTGQDTEGEAE
jgi:small-conductance mechanosensitive channel